VRWPLLAAGVPALAIAPLSGAPWPAVLLAVLSCAAAYTARWYLLYRLASKALDKVDSAGIPAVMTSVTGQTAEPAQRSRRAVNR
jgi:hypothetical protein